jgi:hypothetical protein
MGKKARRRASKAKKRREGVPPEPAPHPPRRSKAELEQERAELDESWQAYTAIAVQEEAELAGTHNLVDRERMVKERLSFVAEKTGGRYDDPAGLVVAALKEMRRLWEVAAHAATAAVATAAAAAIYKAELEVGKERAMPAASGSAAAQHAVGMLLYIFDCDSGSKADFLDAARWIRKAARQGLDVVGPCKLNPGDPNSLKAPGFDP